MAIELSEKQKRGGWQVVRFDEIARNISERVEPSATDLKIYVGLEHLDPQSLRITRYGVPSDVSGQKLRVRPGQIIFGKRRAYQKKLAVADFDGICSAHAMVLEALPGKIIPELLPFLMQSDMFMDRAVAISEGSLSPTIKWKALAMQKFPLPPLDRQKEILEVLEKVEEGVVKIFDALNVGAIVKRIMQYRFTTFGLSNNGDKPAHWKKSKFINLATLQRGFDLPEQNRIDGNYPIFASANIVGCHNEYMVEAPGVLTGRSGTIGQVTYTDEKFWPLNTTLYVKDFHGNDAKYVKYFIEAFHVERFATGTGVPTLNRNIVHNEKVSIPSVNEQKRIVKILSNADEMINSITRRKNNYLKLRSNVVLHLFGGTQ